MIAIKQYRSWTKPDGINDLIAIKKVDWSIFVYGSHIPLNFHEDFEMANDNIHVELGTNHDVELLINDDSYDAILVNIDRKQVDYDTYQIRYDSNNELKQLFNKKFNTSYNYLKDQRNNSESNRQHTVPEDMAEFIEFYETGEPFKYKLNLVTSDKMYVSEETENYNPEQLINQISNYIFAKGFAYLTGLIENFYLSLKTKPFVLLAGISGTGKTKLIKLFAEAIGCNYKLISVRPDWSDSSDLLGYKNIQDKFQPGPIIDFIKEANDDPDNIYFVCLDEMNLARVEYYFSDFLSIMETREKKDNRIITDKLMTEKDFSNESDMQYADLTIPDNLYIIGTVNMDETTHPFSKKVLDRANTIEFSEINLDQYSLNDKVKETAEPVRINNDYLKAEYITLNDCTEEEEDTIVKTIDKLEEINEILKEANLQVGYRVRDEVCFYMIYNEREELLEENIAFDFQLMQKILPRIQGSTEAIKKVLIDLFKLTANHDLSREDSLMKGDKAVNYVDVNQDDLIYPRSAEKIAYMIKRFEEDGFTAYWL